MDDTADQLPADDPADNGGTFGGRRRHAIELENRPTRLLSDHVQVHELLNSAQQLALTRSLKDTLELVVRALRQHTRSSWAVAWRLEDTGEQISAASGIEQVPQVLVSMMRHYRQTCTYNEGAYADAPLVATPILMGERIVGALGMQMQSHEVSEDELLTCEFLAALCAVGQTHGQMLTSEERARKSAQTAKENQSDFLSQVSHDVRGPLAVIKGYSQMLIDGGDQIDSGQREMMISKIGEQTERIDALVNGLIDVARSESGQLNLTLEMLNPVEVVRRALELTDPTGQYRIEANGPEFVAQIDRLRIEQIVANLVGNALKYGEPPFVIRIAPDPGELSWKMEVADGGEGLPAETEANLFQRFVPGAKTIGLGLSIVQALVLAHQGEVGYERRDVAGQRESVFVIRMPRRLAGH